MPCRRARQGARGPSPGPGAAWARAAFKKHVRRRHEIAVDVFDVVNRAIGIVDGLGAVVNRGHWGLWGRYARFNHVPIVLMVANVPISCVESDYHAMDGGVAFRLVVPLERAVGEVADHDCAGGAV